MCNHCCMMSPQSYADAYVSGMRRTMRLLLSKGLVASEAEELAQSAWVRGWEARDQLKDKDRIVSWVNSIAMHTMFNQKRRSKRQEELDERTAEAPVDSSARIDARRLLDRCSRLDRSLMVHHYASGIDMEEVARLHGMTSVAARVRIHRAKAALRRHAGVEALPAAA